MDREGGGFSPAAGVLSPAAPNATVVIGSLMLMHCAAADLTPQDTCSAPMADQRLRLTWTSPPTAKNPLRFSSVIYWC